MESVHPTITVEKLNELSLKSETTVADLVNFVKDNLDPSRPWLGLDRSQENKLRNLGLGCFGILQWVESGIKPSPEKFQKILIDLLQVGDNLPRFPFSGFNRAEIVPLIVSAMVHSVYALDGIHHPDINTYSIAAWELRGVFKAVLDSQSMGFWPSYTALCFSKAICTQDELLSVRMYV
jgi:hypothetical protein